MKLDVLQKGKNFQCCDSRRPFLLYTQKALVDLLISKLTIPTTF